MQDWERKYTERRLKELARFQKKYPDLSKLTVLKKHKTWEGDHDATEYLVKAEETDEFKKETILFVYHPEGIEHSRSIHYNKSQKFLCVNGPEISKKLTLTEGENLGYRLYNNSSRPRRNGKETPTAVLVHF